MGIFDKLFGRKKETPIPTEEIKPVSSPSYVPKEEPKPEPENVEITVPPAIDGKMLAYHYDDVKLTSLGVPLSQIKISEQLSFSDDGEEVSVKQNDIVIGYMPHNRLAGMVRDWNKNNDPYLSYITKYSDDAKDIEIFIGFYTDVMGNFLKKNPGAKLVKLTGKPEEFATATEGSRCEVEYDVDSEKYLVLQDGCEIGKLPASAIKYAETHDIEPEDLDVIVATVDYDFEKDRDIISVYISD